jgi:hypothetical protein
MHNLFALGRVGENTCTERNPSLSRRSSGLIKRLKLALGCIWLEIKMPTGHINNISEADTRLLIRLPLRSALIMLHAYVYTSVFIWMTCSSNLSGILWTRVVQKVEDNFCSSYFWLLNFQQLLKATVLMIELVAQSKIFNWSILAPCN